MSKFIELTAILPNGELGKRCFNTKYIFAVHIGKDGTIVTLDTCEGFVELLVGESYREIVAKMQ